MTCHICGWPNGHDRDCSAWLTSPPPKEYPPDFEGHPDRPMVAIIAERPDGIREVVGWQEASTYGGQVLLSRQMFEALLEAGNSRVRHVDADGQLLGAIEQLVRNRRKRMERDGIDDTAECEPVTSDILVDDAELPTAEGRGR